jgi:hypothetical protein
MKRLLAVCLFFGLISQGITDQYSTEDESRFRSEPYTKAGPGMLTPAAYIERAKAALHKRYKNFGLAAYNDPVVTRRFYLDAPPADRDVICVEFDHKEPIKTPLAAAKRLPNPQWIVTPALLVLLRKDLSKIYVNEVYYQFW